MKRLLVSLIFLIGLSISAFGQVIESFDSDLSADTTIQFITEGPPSRIDYSLNTADKREGTGSANLNMVIGSHHEWGSYAQLLKRLPDGQYWDWSSSDSLALWIKVVSAPAIPANMVLRIHLADRLVDGGQIEEYIYEHTTLIDAQTDWIELKVPIKILSTDGSLTPVDSGFVIFPSSWGGGAGTWNNSQFDWDKIVGFNIAAVTSAYTPGANLPADSVVLRVDGFRRFGNRSVPAIVFNGLVFPSNLSTFAWGQSALEVVAGAGPVANSNAVKWTQGNEWGNGWTGMGLNVSPAFNLGSSWMADSVKFKIKCAAGVGALRVQFEGGGGKKGTVFTPIADGNWHSYAFALREMTFQDGTTFIDSTNINVVGMMAEATGVAGNVVWITDWWTGNPTFDVLAPNPPQTVAANPGSFQNLVTWQDVPGETGEKYNVYYSKNPITSVTMPGIEVVKLGVPENSQLMEHLLLAPNTNQQVTYYYAVTCEDAAGNVSVLSQNSSPVVNTAKGRPTVSLSAPANFVADGNLTEWQGITPFRMFSSDGTGFIVTNTTINGDNDCSALAYVAVDNQYLYVAFDVNDDIVVPNTNPQHYLNDAPDLFIGLYDYRGIPHKSYKRGAQPDYHLRFAYNRVVIDNTGGTDSLVGLGTDYYWGEKFPNGYVTEFRVKWSDLAAPGNDNVFTPAECYRLPIDFAINDADATGSREGILTYSPYNEDQSYNDVSRWLYTWIGNLWEPTGVNDGNLSVDSYGLSQNYPNPFNPVTKLQYSIKHAGHVSLRVYDVLGAEVATLVQQEQAPGVYTVQFDGSHLSSGIYFYKLESGTFSQVHKMLLLK